MNKKKESKVVPNVRFKGFTDDWKQRKLGKMMNITSVKRIHQSDWTDSGVRFLRARDIVAASKNEEPDDYLYISEEKYEEYSALSGKVDINDLLVTGVGTIGVPYLVENLEPLYFKDGNIIWFKNKNKIDGKFLYYSFIGNGIQSFIKASAGTGTVGTYTIDTGKKTPIQIPSKEEQRKIGEYLTNIDHLITLHQRKIDKLKNLKKSMLEKMFPKKGSLIPEFRFNGFANAWEQRKLNEVLSFLKDGTHGTHADDENGPLLLSAKNIKNGKIICDETDRRISEEEYEKIHTNFSLEVGDVLLTIVGSIGETAILKDCSSITFQRSVAFLRPNGTITSDFLYSEIQTQKFQNELDSRKSTSAQPGIYLGDLSEIPIVFTTNLDEQTKIGDYFNNLDHLITLHQRKIDMLKKLKSACLSEMFI